MQVHKNCCILKLMVSLYIMVTNSPRVFVLNNIWLCSVLAKFLSPCCGLEHMWTIHICETTAAEFGVLSLTSALPLIPLYAELGGVSESLTYFVYASHRLFYQLSTICRLLNLMMFLFQLMFVFSVKQTLGFGA